MSERISTDHRRRGLPLRRATTYPDSGLLVKHRGAFSELCAVQWLMLQGYEVFRNVSQHGMADIVAWKAEEGFRLFDVKTFSEVKRKDGTICFGRQPASATQLENGVTLIHVRRDGTVEPPNQTKESL